MTYTISSTKESVASVRRLGSSYLSVAKSTKCTTAGVNAEGGAPPSVLLATEPNDNPSASQRFQGVRSAGVSPSKQGGGGAEKESNAMNRIGCLRSKLNLPLSRLKIVIVVWQISSAVRTEANKGTPAVSNVASKIYRYIPCRYVEIRKSRNAPVSQQQYHRLAHNISTWG